MAQALETMTQELIEERDKNGYSKKLYRGSNYKIQADEHKGEVLAADIMARANALLQSEERGKVNFGDVADVQARVYNYFQACAAAEVYPSVMGLAVHGFGISRQALNQYMLRNPNSRATEFITKAKDVMADILTNASLYNNANAVQALFQLKNHFEHSDRVEVQSIPVRQDDNDFSVTIDEAYELLHQAYPNRDISELSETDVRCEALALKYGIVLDDE